MPVLDVYNKEYFDSIINDSSTSSTIIAVYLYSDVYGMYDVLLDYFAEFAEEEDWKDWKFCKVDGYSDDYLDQFEIDTEKINQMSWIAVFRGGKLLGSRYVEEKRQIQKFLEKEW